MWAKTENTSVMTARIVLLVDPAMSVICKNLFGQLGRISALKLTWFSNDSYKIFTIENSE